MFETVSAAPPDSILGLTVAFHEDSNPKKVNLGVGVYKDAAGRTPILDCVKEAERRLLETESTKSYLGIDGLPDYTAATQRLLFGEEHEIVTSGRAATIQSPGGTGALRLAADFLHTSFPVATVWLSSPTWANHKNIFTAAGCETREYTYFDAEANRLDFRTMLDDLEEAKPGDVVLLHGCCHNPTGVDPSADQWQQIAEFIADRDLLPLNDFAYQGFGTGIIEDAAGLMELARPEAELLVCSSYSKNFGLYSERVGTLTAVGRTVDAAGHVRSQIMKVARSNYSNPPKHGAAIVATVLADEELKAQWHNEVAQMRDRINGMRRLLVDTMRQKDASRDFSFITEQQGMFSFSGLTQSQVETLRREHSIYIVSSGRINVAGMTEENVDRLCDAICSVL